MGKEGECGCWLLNGDDELDEFFMFSILGHQGVKEGAFALDDWRYPMIERRENRNAKVENGMARLHHDPSSIWGPGTFTTNNEMKLQKVILAHDDR
jgi:hypothetical protein